MSDENERSAAMLGSHGCHPNARLIVSGSPTIDEYRTALAECVAAPSPASDGSQPVAWAVDRGAVYCQLCHTHCDALYVASRAHGSVVFPLYRQPQPTLTDAEREAVAYFGKIEGGQYLDAANRHAATLRGLLQRTK